MEWFRGGPGGYVWVKSSQTPVQGGHRAGPNSTSCRLLVLVKPGAEMHAWPSRPQYSSVMLEQWVGHIRLEENWIWGQIL